MNIFFQRAFWLNLAGFCVVAIGAGVPILMSGVMDRGFEIAKQSLAEPLAVLAFGAVLLAGEWNWRARQGLATKFAAGSLAVFLLLAVVSSALSENPEVAIFGGYYRREGLLAWCAYGAFFFALLAWARHTDRMAAFLDVLLLASVIPASYAVQQRFGLDFYDVAGRELARPGGTLGSPLFLAAYLGVLLPLTVVRCWQTRRRLPELALWLTVISLQICALLLTQTRGPLLAVFSGILMLACFAAGYARARSVFFGIAGVFALTVSALIAINTLDGARHWAQDMPVVGRLVFNLDRDARAETRRASTSAAARLALWQAGAETFAAAPRENKLFGYGPESAFTHYFPHVSASAARLIGYDVYDTYDRMHADTLDIGLNFGVLAWLAYCLFFCVVMYAAARALWGLSGAVALGIFFAFTCVGGALASIAAVKAGLASAAAPAFGLGVGAGWFLFMVIAAWRAAGPAARGASMVHDGRWSLLAGLVSALWIFWMDAQVNIPVLTTRLISFAIAALILIIADGLIRGDEKDTKTEPVGAGNLRVWGVACALVAICAGCLPVTTFAAGISEPALHWLRRIFPVFSFLLVAAFAAWAYARRNVALSQDATRSWFAIALGVPALYAALHYALTAAPGSELNLQHVQSVAVASFAALIFIFAMCVAFALLAGRRAAPPANQTSTALIARAARWLIGPLAVAVGLVAVADWNATQADVALRLASKLSAQQQQLRDRLIEAAIRVLPYERHYRRQLVFERLGRVVAEIRALKAVPQQVEGLQRHLEAAESAARTAALLFPHDPWVVVTLANVQQIAGLRVLRPLDPERGLRAAREAEQLFARVHRMFPSQPLFLRNWAQLRAEQGDLTGAYRLLDLMEKLIPNEPEAYAERMAIARQAADKSTISATLMRAHAALDTAAYEQLLSVANGQQE